MALARALAPRPELLLLDEPFSNLDVELRERLSLEVRDIIRASGATAILVTHDQHEAFAMADEIGILHEGHIQQWDTAYNLYHRPVNRFVADFVGQGVFLPASRRSATELEIELGVLQGNSNGEQNVEVLLRPDDVVHDDAAPIRAEVVHKAFRGAEILYTLRLESGRKVLALVPSHHNHALGERIGIRLDVDHVVAFQSLNLAVDRGDVDRKLLAAQERRHGHGLGRVPEHLGGLLVEHVVARGSGHGERRKPPVRAELHAQCHESLPVVLARHAGDSACSAARRR